jgi:hypothetical protein
MRRSRLPFSLAALCAALALVMNGPWAGHAAESPRATYAEVDAALHVAEGVLARHPVDRLGGISILDGSILDIALTGPADRLDTALRNAVPGHVLRLRSVKRPYAELLRLTSRSAADQAALTARGISLTSFGPDPATNTVSVGLDGDDPAGREALTREYGDALTFRTERRGVLASRAYDSPPWNGGDHIVDSGRDEGCTSGPPVRSANGVEYFVTAAHCYALNELVHNSINTPNASNYMGYVAWRDGRTSNSTDSALVRADVSTLDWRSTYAAHQVSFAGHDYVGELVCTSGAYNAPKYGGELCGVRITDVDRCFVTLGLQTCGVTFAAKSGWTVARVGDSGGPVYNSVGGNLNVRGMIHALNNSYVCPDGFACANEVVYVQISHILSFWNVSLNTWSGG